MNWITSTKCDLVAFQRIKLNVRHQSTFTDDTRQTRLPVPTVLPKYSIPDRNSGMPLDIIGLDCNFWAGSLKRTLAGAAFYATTTSRLPRHSQHFVGS